MQMARLKLARSLPAAATGPAALERLRATLATGEASDEPRHSRLRAAMLDLMAKGYWSPGAKVPPEKEIAQAVGLSLGTVQKALARLAASGVLVRRHGHGTFVNAGSQGEQLLHFRFAGDDGAAVAAIYAEALDRKEVKTKGPWSTFLPAASSFIRVRRRINVAGEFDCLSEFYVDAGPFREFLAMPFEELHRVTLRTLLAQHFNAPTLSIKQRAYASEFSDPVAAVVHSPRGKHFGMVLEVFSYTHHQAPVSFQRIYIPAGARHLEIPSPHLRPI